MQIIQTHSMSFERKPGTKTIVTKKEVPSFSEVLLHSKRISYVIKINANACVSELVDADPFEHGWIWNEEEGNIYPEW